MDRTVLQRIIVFVALAIGIALFIYMRVTEARSAGAVPSGHISTQTK